MIVAVLRGFIHILHSGIFWYNDIVTQQQFDKFISYLQKNDWSVFGPVFTTEKIEELSPFLAAHQPSATQKIGQVLIKEIKKAEDLNLDGQLPFYSFKRFFVPEKETLFEYKGSKLKEARSVYPERSRRALVGMNILDLKAVNLYDQVFEKDPYYQVRRRNLLIVGYSLTPDINNNIFEQKYEEDILEHLPFDIFLAEIKPPNPPLHKGGRKNRGLRKGGDRIKLRSAAIYKHQVGCRPFFMIQAPAQNFS